MHDLNLMKINDKKSNFIIFSRSKDNFTARLGINNVTLNNFDSYETPWGLDSSGFRLGYKHQTNLH